MIHRCCCRCRRRCARLQPPLESHWPLLRLVGRKCRVWPLAAGGLERTGEQVQEKTNGGERIELDAFTTSPIFINFKNSQQPSRAQEHQPGRRERQTLPLHLFLDLGAACGPLGRACAAAADQRLGLVTTRPPFHPSYHGHQQQPARGLVPQPHGWRLDDRIAPAEPHYALSLRLVDLSDSERRRGKERVCQPACSDIRKTFLRIASYLASVLPLSTYCTSRRPHT